MKMPAQSMFAETGQPIDDRQRAVGVRHAQRSLVRDRAVETLVPVVTARVLDALRRLVEGEVLRVRRLEQTEDPFRLQLVLLFAVDLQRVVRRCASKQISR